MPPQNQPNQNNLESQPSVSEQQDLRSGNLSQSPENMPPQPVSGEIPKTEVFTDQQTNVPAQNHPQASQEPPSAVPTQPPSDDLEEKEAEEGVPDTDKKWVDAVENVIQKDQGKPYEKEEDAEKLQVDYLNQKYGKKIDPNNG